MTASDERNETLSSLAELSAALRAFFARRVPAGDVDDLLQECYLRVAQGLPSLRDRDRLGAWVFRIARNLVSDRRRARRSEPATDSEPADVAAAADHDLEIAGWLEAFVDRLPAKYATVLRLAEFEQLPYREIAGRMGLSVSGVKARVQRGRALLRESLLACCTLEFDRRGRIRDWGRNAPGRCDC
jgi:RNA polymerase sigma-70 factor (ECF subfamily)